MKHKWLYQLVYLIPLVGLLKAIADEWDTEEQPPIIILLFFIIQFAFIALLILLILIYKLIGWVVKRFS